MGGMLYKEDWEEWAETYRAWWEGELREALLQVIHPRPEIREWGWWDDWAFVRYGGASRAIEDFEAWCHKTEFRLGAFPNLWVNFGPGILGAMLGSQFVFTGDTVWFKPPAEPMRLENVAELELDRSNEWWIAVKRATEEVSAASAGKFVVGITDIGGVLDVLASLRGTSALIRDMFSRPSLVEEAIARVLDLWHECYDELRSVMPPDGMSSWMSIWCSERWYPIQCDIAYMLSPSLFERFVEPHIREQCVRLDRTIYHLDGPGQLPHVDRLLRIEELDGIQWVPGAAMSERGYHRGSSVWLPLYRKVQRAGKRLVLSVPPEGVRLLLEELSTKGLLLSVTCDSAREAEELLARLPRDKVAGLS